MRILIIRVLQYFFSQVFAVLNPALGHIRPKVMLKNTGILGNTFFMPNLLRHESKFG